MNNKRGQEVKGHFSQRSTADSVAERQGLQRGGSLYETDCRSCRNRQAWGTSVSVNALAYNLNYKLGTVRKALFRA